MREVQATLMMNVPDDVTDEQIAGWMATVIPLAHEPVYGHDRDGNELTFPSSEVFSDLFIDGRPAAVSAT